MLPLLLSVLAMFAIACGLAEFYALGMPFVAEPWQSPAIVNSVVSIGILIFYYRYERRNLLSVSFSKTFYFPSLMIALLTIIGATSTWMFVAGAVQVPISSAQIWWVLWIPVVEEIVFRGGIGAWMRQISGNLWGAYISALGFSLIHTLPTAYRIAHLEIGLVLGPFLLALVCEWLFIQSGSLLPAILFHAVCNGTVLIFQAIDSRWLSWLKMLYL